MVELLFVLFLVEQLAARNAVDLGAQLGDAILVAELHLGLAGDQPGEHVLAEGEIGGGADRPQRHDDEGADHHPEGGRPQPQLAPGVDQRIAAPYGSGRKLHPAIAWMGRITTRVIVR